MEPPWYELIGATAKLTAVAFLFAYLLYLGGVRPRAAALITAAHVQLLLCMCPLSAETIFFGLVMLGTCSYSVLVLDPPKSRAWIVIACFLAFAPPIFGYSPAGSLVLATALGLWAGFMVSIRDWARQEREVCTEAE